jgi:hypothetical protein
MESSDDGGHLEDVRNNKGRVGHNAKVMGIANNSEIDKIKHAKVVTAGVSKAGWLQAIISIGAKSRIPAWLRKKDSLGYGTIQRNGWRTVVTLHNRVKYVSNLLPQSKINKVMRTAYLNQIKKLQKQLAALGKNF